jgi:hypothetical protein
MAEVFVGFGAAAAVAQLARYGFGGTNGLYDISTRARDAPITLQQWNDELQGFLSLVEDLEAEPALRENGASGMLRRLTDNANALTPQLEELTMKDRDRIWTRARKRLKIVFKEKGVSRNLSLFRHGSEHLQNHVLL